MKDDLINLLRQETEHAKFGDFLFKNNLARLEKYLANFQDLTNNFIKLKAKYNFKNMADWSEDPEYYPHLSLFKSMTETTLHLCIDYEGSVSPNDPDLSPLVKDPMIYEEPTYNEEEEEYYYVDANDEIHNKIFFTLLSIAWIKSNGQACGLVVKTLENNSTQSFYLNDLKWNGTSRFQNYNDKTQAVSNTYKDSISYAEIFESVCKKWVR